jgi:hypothetical protein
MKNLIEQHDISWNPIKKKFDAYLSMNREYVHLGSFQSVEDAAQSRTASAWSFVNLFANYS